MTVSLMVTCLGDVFRPAVGRATVRLLRRLGVQVRFPRRQTCCGQPFYNSGYANEARRLARHTIRVFDDGLPVVVPSGSCAAMVRLEYLHLFEGDPRWHRRAQELARRTFELAEFLVHQLGVEDVGARWSRDGSDSPQQIAYHYACHLRGLGLTDEAERLIRQVKGVELVPMERADQCCGFGGSFSVRYPQVSGAMVGDKVESIARSGACAMVSTDTGCLMNIAGCLHRRGSPIRAMHLAELLEPSESDEKAR